MHNEICSICKGVGRLPSAAHTVGSMQCHGCDGRGWIAVGDSSGTNPISSITTAAFPPGDPIWVVAHPPTVTYSTGGTGG